MHTGWRIAFATTMEIFSNGSDLSIRILPPHDGRFGFVITRGPADDLRPLLTMGPRFASPDDAATFIKDGLEFIERSARKALDDPDSPASKWVNGCGASVDRARFLNPQVIGWIDTQLRAQQAAYTNTMPVAVAA